MVANTKREIERERESESQRQRVLATKLWLPVITMGSFVSLGTVQKLSTLLPSSASAEDKLHVASMIAESATASLVADDKRAAAVKKKLWTDAIR